MISNFWTTGGGHVWPGERVERAARALCACVECWRGRATPRVLYSYFRLSPLASLDPPVSLRITPSLVLASVVCCYHIHVSIM